MTTPDLPNDVVEEILCHVPARSMKRLRSTSKGWNDLFKDRRFARKHFDKAAKEFPLLMLTKYYNICPISVNLHHPISVEFKGKHSLLDPQSCNNSVEFEIGQVFHCDGLLLCTCKYDSRTVVWNPCTGETRWIKAGNFSKKGRCFAFGYYRQDKKNKSYKIAVLYSVSRYSEIYEFNFDSWKIVDDIAPGWCIGYSDHSVSLKGKSYCFGIDLTEMRLGVSLLRFDFATEKYEPVPLPYQQQCDSYEAVSVSVVREEKLSVLLQRKINSKTEIWLTNKIDDDETKAVVSWSLVLTLDLSTDLQISNFGYFVLDEEKKAVVCCAKWMDLEDEYRSIDKIYIVEEDNKVTQVDYGSDTDCGCFPVILNYVPGLVQLEGAGSKRKRDD